MNEVINKLIIERDELQEKLDNLIGFTYSDLFAALDPIQVRLLIIQRNVMGSYIEILNMRIDTLKETNNVQ